MMPRLRHAVTGVVVSVDDATASRLGNEWRPVEAAKPAPAKRSPKKKTDK